MTDHTHGPVDTPVPIPGCQACWDAIEGDGPMRKYVTAYEVTRHYGGPEEGGWWYNWDLPVDTIPCEAEHAEEVRFGMESKHRHREQGDIYSVLGGTAVFIAIENVPGENATTERPHYS